MTLYTCHEVEKIQQDITYLIEIQNWIKSFLARHHVDLGRTGPVCPYVPHALKSDGIKMAVIHTQNNNLQEIAEIVTHYRQIFLQEAEIKEQDLKIYQAFLLIFPDIHQDAAGEIIDHIQRQLKPSFVESGLMIGEFHQRTESAGLHNPKFRPLRSPIPLLAIRFMSEFDLPFLQSPDNPHLRIRYLESYLQRFSHRIKDEAKLKNIHAILKLAKQEIQAENLVTVR
ncbi:hypothetical protein B6N60_03011 [Richelia sinica FACHB-800]|uniref:DUF6875 domain-containing protein n=1 Tax=Richelia sinica FACHB-800 TaxID=1357546 RepID=A0A975T8Q4_9NOST|nr:hypothetical protein [Richelia sinica]MBD2665047.1 hypothetical protein [Richelia sinica FACHB-800]QXE24306.1 hypothetical protein B6N60_03011 [Richelia sinica FACHB-800]